MYQNYYEPNKFEIKKNQTIKFIVYNYGELVHEFNIATKAMHLKHQPEMMKMVENEILLVDKIDKKKMKELSKKDHSMSHSHSNSVLLEPNQSAELIWKFNTNADLEAACNVPGHYEAGMIAKINNLQPRLISNYHHYKYEYNQNNKGSKKILHILILNIL